VGHIQKKLREMHRTLGHASTETSFRRLRIENNDFTSVENWVNISEPYVLYPKKYP